MTMDGKQLCDMLTPVSSEYIASSGTDVTLNSNYLVVVKFIFTIVQEAIIF